MPVRFTKTFTQSTWYRRVSEEDRTRWERISVPATGHKGFGNISPIDQQVAAWVRRTRSVIVHPGQLGIHTQWYDRDLTIKCVTFGLTVLYMEEDDAEGIGFRTEVARPFHGSTGGGGSSDADHARGGSVASEARVAALRARRSPAHAGGGQSASSEGLGAPVHPVVAFACGPCASATNTESIGARGPAGGSSSYPASHRPIDTPDAPTGAGKPGAAPADPAKPGRTKLKDLL
jgi:hypothetical protein